MNKLPNSVLIFENIFANAPRHISEPRGRESTAREETREAINPRSGEDREKAKVASFLARCEPTSSASWNFILERVAAPSLWRDPLYIRSRLVVRHRPRGRRLSLQAASDKVASLLRTSLCHLRHRQGLAEGQPTFVYRGLLFRRLGRCSRFHNTTQPAVLFLFTDTAAALSRTRSPTRGHRSTSISVSRCNENASRRRADLSAGNSMHSDDSLEVLVRCV